MVRADKRIGPSPGVCVLPATPAGEYFNINPDTIQQSFQAWLHGMKPAPRRRPPDLTSRQRTAVSLATVGEHLKHRRWPVEIVERFIAAEVITPEQPPRPARGLINGVARRFQSLRADGISYAGIVGTFRR